MECIAQSQIILRSRPASYGSDFYFPHEKGTPKTWSNGNPLKTYHTATGSGPETWNHNWKADGIADLNGNLSEWQGGIRLMSGEINMIRDADCIMNGVSQAEDSLAWMAIDEDDHLVPRGTSAGIKLDFVDLAWKLINGDCFESQKNTTRYCFFQDMSHGLKQVPQSLKELAMFPADSELSGYAKEFLSAYNGPCERMLYRGGSYAGTSFVGMFCSGLNLMRNFESAHFGFRSAYYGNP